MSEVEAWVISMQNQGKSPHTVRVYRYQFDLFRKWFEDYHGIVLRFDKVTPRDIRNFRSYLQNVRKSKYQTVNQSLTAVMACLSFLDAYPA